MAYVFDTNVAAVKMSGSFAAPDFSSSDEGEEEILPRRRPRSNAVSELDTVPVATSDPLLEPDVSDSNLRYTQNSGPLPSSESNLDSACTVGVSISSSDYATEMSPTTKLSLGSSTLPSELGSRLQVRKCDSGELQSSCGSALKKSDIGIDYAISSHTQNNYTDALTLEDMNKSNEPMDKDLSNPGTKNTTPLSSPEKLGLSSIRSRPTSSPVIVNNVTASRLNSANGNQSSASSASSSREIYFQSRFNPFDHDIHMEEDHFSDNPDDNFFRCHNSSPISALSSHSSDHCPGESVAEDNDTVTFAELGLAEDHFSHPGGHFGLSQTEELELAIDNCKTLIGKALTDSERQKNLVQKLVQLRLKLQEMKDEPEVSEKNVVSVLGHRLKWKGSRSTKYYCGKCNGIIWGLVQEWRKCLDCGYKCHDKCVSQITRKCAMVKVKENATFIMEVCPRHPKGLLGQDYRCAECKALISVADGIEPRLCEYNGRYYCELCHWNDLMYIPSHILLNWEFEKRKVCRASRQFLKLMMKKAVIVVEQVNPLLFNYVDQLRVIKTLREELLMMKKYILACPLAMQAKMLLQLSSRPHFVECSDRYSLQDLLDSDDSLIPQLVQVHAAWAQHIKTDCELCQGRGYVCELCTSKEVLFPFDNVAVVCPGCSAVMHRICFTSQVTCPKCERHRKRQQEEKDAMRS